MQWRKWCTMGEKHEKQQQFSHLYKNTESKVVLCKTISKRPLVDRLTPDTEKVIVAILMGQWQACYLLEVHRRQFSRVIYTIIAFITADPCRMVFAKKKHCITHMARVDIIYSLCLLNARSQAIFLGPVVDGDFAISAYLL